jgi:hypothetical protein
MPCSFIGSAVSEQLQSDDGRSKSELRQYRAENGDGQWAPPDSTIRRKSRDPLFSFVLRGEW